METEQSFDSVYSLYCSLSLPEVGRVLDHTRKEAEQKRQQLKTLVTQRYPDLIQSADAIVGMEKNVEEFKRLVRSTETDQEVLTKNRISFSLQNGDRSGDNGFQGVASERLDLDKADYISKAAPRMWELIDNGDLQKAALLFVEAKSVYNSLEQSKLENGASHIMEPPLESEQTEYKSEIKDLLESLTKKPADSKLLASLVSLPRVRPARNVSNSQQHISVVYPFLKSHFSLVQECSEKVAESAAAVLEDPSLSAMNYCGAVYASLMVNHEDVKDPTRQAEIAVDLFFDSSSRWVKRLCSKLTRTSEAESSKESYIEALDLRQSLHEVLSFLKSVLTLSVNLFGTKEEDKTTHQNVAALFWPSPETSDDALETLESLLTKKLKSWVQQEEKIIVHLVESLAQRLKELSDLASVRETLLIASSEFDDDHAWKRASAMCQAKDDKNWLYLRFFEGAFITKANKLIASTFKDVFDQVRTLTQRDQKASSSKASTSRASRAIRSATVLNNQLTALVDAANKMEFQQSLCDLVDDTCSATLDATLKWISKQAENLIEAEAFEVEKALFLARVSESLQCVELVAEFTTKHSSYLDALEEQCELIYRKWAQVVIDRLMQKLRKQLDEDVWRFPESWRTFHGGWESFDLELEGEEESNGEDAMETETVWLPTSASPSIAHFVFSLKKSTSQLGDLNSLREVGAALYVDEEDIERNEELEKRCREKFTQSSSKHTQNSATVALEAVVTLLQNIFQQSEPEAIENEPAALQSLFDVEWIHWQLVQNKQKHASITAFKAMLIETQIDPVNWAICENCFKQNVSNFRERGALISLGLRWDSETVQTKGTKAKHSKPPSSWQTNLMPVHPSIARIPLLPVPSTMRSARKKAMRRGGSSGRSSLSKAKSVKYEKSEVDPASVSEAAIARVTKVGTNLFSQATSYFNQ